MRGQAVAMVGAALAAGAVLGACGSPPTSQATDQGVFHTQTPTQEQPASPFASSGEVAPFTAAGLTAWLTGQVTARMPAGTRVAASCPAPPASRTTQVHCTVTIAGTPVDWVVTNFHDTVLGAEPAGGLLRLDQARAAVVAKFAPDYTDPVVDCGPGVVVVVKTDDELTCVIRSGDRQHVAHVVVTDALGSFTVTP